MEIKNIDLIYSTSGNRIYPASMESFIINQYATNYKLRVGIYYSDTDTEKLFINTVKAVIFNGKSNPARVLYNDEKTTYSGKEVEVYTYQLTQYDTYLYNENMEISINITLHDGTEFMDTISLPMIKQNFGKITPQPLESDGTLNSVIEGTNVMREDINRILEGGGQFPAEVIPEPNSLVLRDENGRSKVEDPEHELDITNKRYVDKSIEGSHMVNITQMKTSYASPEAIRGVVPKEGNGARYLVYTNGKTPLYYYSYNASNGEWEQGYRLKGSTIYINLENGRLYRYTNSMTTKPYPNFIELTLNSAEIQANYPDNDEMNDAISDACEETLKTAKAYADGKITDLIDSSPATLNTLNELAAALGDDPNFATTILTRIGEDEKLISALEGGKVDKLTAEGTGLVYAVNPKNVTVGIPLTEDATPESAAFRDLNGTFSVGDPVEESHPATKGYTDTELAKKLNKPTEIYTVPAAIIMAANSTNQTVIGISQTDTTASNGRLAAYRASSGGTTEPAGKLVTGTPTQNYQAATKKYVDDSVAGAINGTVKAGNGISISTSNSVSTITNTKELYSYYISFHEQGETMDLTFIAPKLDGLSSSGTAITSTSQIQPLYDYLVSNGFNTVNNLLTCSGSDVNGNPVIGICYILSSLQAYSPKTGKFWKIYINDNKFKLYYTKLI